MTSNFLAGYTVMVSMKILVTGGAGFIGSKVSRTLTEQGHTVGVLDNFNDYYEVSLKRDRVTEFLDGIEVVEGDIRDRELLDKLFAEGSFDVVCHFAAMAGVRYSVENPALYVDVNITGLTNLL